MRASTQPTLAGVKIPHQTREEIIYIYVYTFYISYIIIYYNFLSPVCVHVRIPGRTYSHIAIYVLQEVNPTSWTQWQPNYEGRQARRGLALPVFHAAHCLVEVNGGAFIFRHRTDSLSSQAFRNLNMQALGRTGISATFLNNNRLLFHARGAIQQVHLIFGTCVKRKALCSRITLPI